MDTRFFLERRFVQIACTLWQQGFFCEWIRANRPNSRCELPGHLSSRVSRKCPRRDRDSGRAKREPAKGRKRTRNAHFRRFSLIFGSLCKSRDLGVADLRRKPEETADFRRKPQKTADFCRNRFLPLAVSLLALLGTAF